MFLSPGSRARPRPQDRDQLGYQLAASVTSGNNLIIGINQVPGATPYLQFRDPTVTSGKPYFRAIPNGAQFIINSGNVMGAASGFPFRLWIVGFDNGSGITLGAINCCFGSSNAIQIYGLDEASVQSPIGNNGGASAWVFYAAQSMTNRPFRILGFMEWSSGLATAGVWNARPTKIQLFGYGIRKPGEEVQSVPNIVGSVATTSVAIPQDDTPPQITEGAQFITCGLTPTSAANVMEITANVFGSCSATDTLTIGIFRDATANALAVMAQANQANFMMTIPVAFKQQAGSTATTTYRLRAGPTVNTTTFTLNGQAGGRLYANLAASSLLVRELMG